MKYKVFIAVFIILCLIPSAFMLFLPEIRMIGNERLSPKPNITTEENKFNHKVLDETTEYIADHFAFRSNWITMNAVLQTKIFHTSPSNEVIYGKDGWLYYEQTLDDFQNNATLSDEDAERIAIILYEIQEYCYANGAKFLFTIAPNKNSLYEENMPNRYKKQNAYGNYEKLKPYLIKYEIHYADLFTLFKNQPDIYYFKTDSHWKTDGAALVHDYLMRELRLPHTDFIKAGIGTEAHKGDLYKMLYPLGTEEEMQTQYHFTFSYVEEPRNTEDILIETSNENGEGKLLFCRDSFGNALYPFLAEDFSETIITREQPYPISNIGEDDVVIIEIVERNIPNILKYSPEMGTDFNEKPSN